MSRMAPALVAALLLGRAPDAGAQPPGDPVADQQREIRALLRPRCDRGEDPEEIVVCGTRDDDRYRVPPQVVPGSARPGERAGGAQRQAMAANDQRCTPVGRAQQCNGGLDVIGIGFTIARAVVEAIADRD